MAACGKLGLSLYAICLRTQFGCKNTNKNVLAAFKRVGLLLAFGLTIVGLAWNELACLCKWNTYKKFRIILSFSLAVLRLPCQVLAVKNDKWEEAGLFWVYSLIHPVERIYQFVKGTLCDIKTIYET